jgi:hypothetical protein
MWEKGPSACHYKSLTIEIQHRRHTTRAFHDNEDSAEFEPRDATKADVLLVSREIGNDRLN